MTEAPQTPTNFIHEAVAEDLRSGRFTYVSTRLPPEPNGYLHIGHVKAFLIDYNIAKDFGGELDLRFDDTNPTKEETEYVDAIQEDAHWLGIEWKQVHLLLGFLRPALRMGDQAGQEGQGLRGRPEPGGGQQEAAAPGPNPAWKARGATARWRKTWTCWNG